MRRCLPPGIGFIARWASPHNKKGCGAIARQPNSSCRLGHKSNKRNRFIARFEPPCKVFFARPASCSGALQRGQVSLVAPPSWRRLSAVGARHAVPGEHLCRAPAIRASRFAPSCGVRRLAAVFSRSGSPERPDGEASLAANGGSKLPHSTDLALAQTRPRFRFILRTRIDAREDALPPLNFLST